MKAELIQTLHPRAGKTNKRISLVKYTFVRDHLFSILAEIEPTHTELMEELYLRVKDNFEGEVQWYGETVKLDLEARNQIARTQTKPPRYILVKNTD